VIDTDILPQNQTCIIQQPRAENATDSIDVIDVTDFVSVKSVESVAFFSALFSGVKPEKRPQSIQPQ